jgi:hypothetical protein
MPLTFYPHSGDIESGSHETKLEVLLEAAERYKALVLDRGKNPETSADSQKRMIPREMQYAFNWDELAKILRELRDLPEGNASARLSKADSLMKLSEVYEVLRGAKMPKLEAVRLALVNEVNQLRGGSGSSAA